MSDLAQELHQWGERLIDKLRAAERERDELRAKLDRVAVDQHGEYAGVRALLLTVEDDARRLFSWWDDPGMTDKHRLTMAFNELFALTAKLKCQHDSGCNLPAVLCEAHGGHDGCAVEEMNLQRVLSDTIAKLGSYVAKLERAQAALGFAQEWWKHDEIDARYECGPMCLRCELERDHAQALEELK